MGTNCFAGLRIPKKWHFNEVIMLTILYTSDLRWFMPISGIYWDGLVVIDYWVYPFIRLLFNAFDMG